MPEYDIYIGGAPIDIYVSAAQGPTTVGGGAGVDTFAELTDKVSANIASINTSVANGLAA